MAGGKVREATRTKRGSRRSLQNSGGGAMGANNERAKEGRGEGQKIMDNERAEA